MDFYSLLALAALAFGVGYWFGRHDKRPAHALPLDPESLQNRVHQQEGTIKALRQVMHGWHQEAVDLGFDGVHSVIQHIKARRHVKIQMRVESKGFDDGMGKVVSLLQTGKAGAAMRVTGENKK